MPLDLGTAVLRMGADASGLTKGLGEADKQVQSWTQRVGQSFTNVFQIATGIGLANIGTQLLAVPKQLATMAFEAISSYEKLGLSLETLAAKEAMTADSTLSLEQAMTQGKIAAKETIAWVEELAVKSPFTSEGVAQAFRMAQAYGFTADEAKRMSQAMIDFAAGSGASEAVMSRIAMVMGQIKGAGKLMGGDMMQLTSAGLPMLKILADYFGKTTAEIIDMRGKGLIPAQGAIEAITRYLETNFQGAAERTATSFAGLTSTMQDLKAINLRELFTEAFVTIQPYIIKFVDMLGSDAFRAKLRDIGGIMADSIAKGIQFAAENGQKFISVAQELLIVFVAIKSVSWVQTIIAQVGQAILSINALIARVQVLNAISLLGAVRSFADLGAAIKLIGAAVATSLGPIGIAAAAIAAVVAGIVLYTKRLREAEAAHNAEITKIAETNQSYEQYRQAMINAGLAAETLSRKTYEAVTAAARAASIQAATAELAKYQQQLTLLNTTYRDYSDTTGENQKYIESQTAAVREQMAAYAALNPVFAEMAVKANLLGEAEVEAAQAAAKAAKMTASDVWASFRQMEDAYNNSVPDPDKWTDATREIREDTKRLLQELPQLYTDIWNAIEAAQNGGMSEAERKIMEHLQGQLDAWGQHYVDMQALLQQSLIDVQAVTDEYNAALAGLDEDENTQANRDALKKAYEDKLALTKEYNANKIAALQAELDATWAIYEADLTITRQALVDELKPILEEANKAQWQYVYGKIDAAAASAQVDLLAVGGLSGQAAILQAKLAALDTQRAAAQAKHKAAAAAAMKITSQEIDLGKDLTDVIVESGDAAKDAAKDAGDAFEDMASRSQSALDTARDNLRDLLKGTDLEVKDPFAPGNNGPFEGLYRLADVAVHGDAASEAAKAMGFTQAEAKKAVSDFLAGIPNAIIEGSKVIDWTGLQNIINTQALGDKIKAAYGKAVATAGPINFENVSPTPNSGTAVVAKFAAQIKAAAATYDLGDVFIRIGATAPQGLQQGILSSSAATEAVGTMVGALETKARETLEAQSPSQVFVRIGKDLIQGLIDGILALAQTVANELTTLVVSLTAKWDEIKAGAETKWAEIRTAIEAKWTEIQTAVVTKATEVGTAIATRWDEIKTAAEAKWDAIKTALEAKWDALKAVVDAKTAELQTALETKWTAIKTTIEAKWDEIKAAVEAKVAVVKTAIDTQIEEIRAAIAAKWTEVKTNLETAWDTIKTAVETKIGEVKTALETKWQEITDFFTTLPETWKTIGEDIISGFFGGITAAWTKAVEGFKLLVGLLPGWAKKILGIASPSKVFEQIGQLIIEGLQLGLAEDTSGTLATLTAHVSLIVSTFENLANNVIAPAAVASAKAITDPISEIMDNLLTIISGVQGLTGFKAELDALGVAGLLAELNTAVTEIVNSYTALAGAFIDKGIDVWSAKAVTDPLAEILDNLTSIVEGITALNEYASLTRVDVTQAISDLEYALGLLIPALDRLTGTTNDLGAAAGQMAQNVSPALAMVREAIETIASLSDVAGVKMSAYEMQTAVSGLISQLGLMLSEIENSLSAAAPYSDVLLNLNEQVTKWLVDIGPVVNNLNALVSAWAGIRQGLSFEKISDTDLWRAVVGVIDGLGKVVSWLQISLAQTTPYGLVLVQIGDRFKKWLEETIPVANSLNALIGAWSGLRQSLDFEEISDTDLWRAVLGMIDGMGKVVSWLQISLMQTSPYGLVLAQIGDQFKKWLAQIIPVVDNLGALVGAWTQIREIATLEPVSDNDLYGGIRQMVDQIGKVIFELQGLTAEYPELLTLNEDFVRCVAQLAELAQSFATLVNGALETMTALADEVSVPADVAGKVGNIGAFIDQVVAALKTVVEKFDYKLLSKTREFAENAGAVLGILKTSIEAMDALTRKIELPDKLDDKLRDLSEFIQKAVTKVGEIADDIDDDLESEAKNLSEAASAVMGGLRDALELALSLPEDWSAPDETTWNAFFGWATGVFEAFARKVQQWTSEQVTDQLHIGGADEATVIGAVAQAFGEVMAGLKAALELALAVPKTWAAPDEATWAAFFTWALQVYEDFVKKVQEWTAEQEDPENEAGVVGAVGSAFGSVMQGLAAAFDVFTGLRTYVPVLQTQLDLFLREVLYIYTQIAIFATGEGVMQATEAVGKFAEANQAIFGGLDDALSLFQELAESIPTDWETFIWKIEALLNRVIATFDGFVLAAEAAGEWTDAAQTFSEALAMVVGVLSDALTLFQDLAENGAPNTANLETFLAAILGVFGKIGTGLAQTAKTAQDTLIAITTLFAEGEIALRAWGVTLATAFLDAFTSTLAGAHDTMDASVTQLLDVVGAHDKKDIADRDGKTIGVAVGQGFVNGVVSTAQQLADAIVGVINAGIGAAEYVLGVASPSKVFFGIGENVGLGLTGGVLDALPSVKQASAALAGALGPAFGSGRFRASVGVNNTRRVVVDFRGQAGGGVPMDEMQFSRLKRELAYAIQLGG